MDYTHGRALGAAISAQGVKSLQIVVEISQNNLFSKLFGGASGVSLQHVSSNFLFVSIAIDSIVVWNDERILG